MIRATITALALMASAAQAGPCRLALALGLDVSGSVDGAEYRLQMDGLARALLRPDVRAAFFAQQGQTVELMVFEWSGPTDQHLVLPWLPIADAAALEKAALTLSRSERAGGDPSTAIGAAMKAGAAQLQSRGHCTRKVLDISGDGISNTGPLPQIARPNGMLQGVTVNGLVILTAARTEGDRVTAAPLSLDDYFQAYVIHGPEAFTEQALGFADYEDAMARKLRRELQGMVLSQRAPTRPAKRQ